ncbi:unnamed protein product [Phytophthora fragariaefolia]|uniref:Unnamed protein product n=1 Tax=Phytophthora fragariaefolia TaxID=1490495 RepID=A0A9W6X864_9STRA|nr:unnamed protein product [Phytophthora fragariaefolia]
MLLNQRSCKSGRKCFRYSGDIRHQLGEIDSANVRSNGQSLQRLEEDRAVEASQGLDELTAKGPQITEPEHTKGGAQSQPNSSCIITSGRITAKNPSSLVSEVISTGGNREEADGEDIMNFAGTCIGAVCSFKSDLEDDDNNRL